MMGTAARKLMQGVCTATTWWHPKSGFPVVVVTRHVGLLQYLREEGYVEDNDEVIPHVDNVEQVADKVVIGNLPLHLASLAYRVVEIPLEIPEDLRGHWTSTSGCIRIGLVKGGSNMDLALNHEQAVELQIVMEKVKDDLDEAQLPVLDHISHNLRWVECSTREGGTDFLNLSDEEAIQLGRVLEKEAPHLLGLYPVSLHSVETMRLSHYRYGVWAWEERVGEIKRELEEANANLQEAYERHRQLRDEYEKRWL